VNFEDFRSYFERVAWPNVFFRIEPEPFNSSKRKWTWSIRKLRERSESLESSEDL
jgi:hypothetical protein